MIYGTRSNGNHHGLVLTKRIVVEAMLDRVAYVPDRNLGSLRVIEPAAGDGAFAIPMIERLYASSVAFDFSFQDALANLTFFELDPDIARVLRQNIDATLIQYAATIPEGMIRVEDFLMAHVSKADLVVGNPPYVRHENIPDAQRQLYREAFSTFRHRSDLYIAFYEKSLRMLTNEGILSFICANRWLKNQYGQRLRDLISLTYSLTEVIDLEDANPFEEDVIAYPAITSINNSHKSEESRYYHIKDIAQLTKLDKDIVNSRPLNITNTKNWFAPLDNSAVHERFLGSIEGQGFRIGIGVATGLDKVYIRKDFETLVEAELLLPILIARDLRGNEFNWSGNHILNPFDSSGKLIDPTHYPRANVYLNSHEEALKKRHVARKSPNAWYRTIDRIYPDLQKKNKILLPDISGNSHLFIDRGNYYPHHNLYYITGNSYDRLVLMACLLMSDFVKHQLGELGTKMNGGYPRWQSQNLKKLRVPILDAMPERTTHTLMEAYHTRDLDTINALITKDNIVQYQFRTGQTALFEPESMSY